MAGERRWLWGWVATIAVLTLVPYVVAVAFTPPGTAFLGSLLNTDDTAQFLAAMRQGREGRWLYRNQFTPEDTRPLVMYPLYVLWGKLTGWALPPLVAYHVLRLAGAIVLLSLVSRLARVSLPGGTRRPSWRTAFFMAAFSSGLSWLAAFLPQEIAPRYMADLSLIELSTFQSFFVVPHFAWGLACELLTYLCFYRAIEVGIGRKTFWRWSLGGGAACLGLGLTFPFLLPVVYAVLGAAAILAMVTRREWARSALWSAITIAALSAVLVAYYGVIFLFDPLWHATHVVGNTTGSPSIVSTILGYGLVLPLAVAGAIWITRKQRWHGPQQSFLLAWAVVNGALPYVPVPFQGRFAMGWHVVLCLLAAQGLHWLVRRLPPARADRVRNIVVILTIPSTLLILLAGPYMAISQGTFPFYLSRDELVAMDWLANRVNERDVVLASYAIGNLIPTRAPCRVFVGHQFESVRLEDKLAMVNAFYADMADTDRQALLDEYGVTFVYYGEIEQKKGGFDPARSPYLEQVYAANGVTIYAVGLETLSWSGAQGG
jgi:hypothetical protein